MQSVHSRWRQALCVAAVSLAASAASAQTLSYSLALSDRELPDYHFDDGQPCAIHTDLEDSTRYRTMQMQVTAAGDYAFEDEWQDGNDASLGVYLGTFNASSPEVNCVASVDDWQTVSLTPGNYTLVLTALDGTEQIPGDFRYSITGPAPVTLTTSPTSPAASIAAVPTLEGAGLGLLAALAGVFGARRLRQQRPISPR